MRTLSQTALERAWSARQSLVWLLDLDAGDWTWRGATRSIRLDENACPARLADVKWKESLPERATPGGLVRGWAELLIADALDATDSLREHLATTPPIGIDAVLRVLWLGADAPALDDAPILLQGRVTRWLIDAVGVRLTLVDELEILRQRRIGRLLRAGMIGGEDSPTLGRTLPLVFGRVEEADLLPLRAGASGRLAASVAADSPVIPLVSVEGFPSVGKAQIDGEIVEYPAIDRAANTLGSSGNPVNRSLAPAAHAKGSLVRQVPSGGFRWLVADHPCRSVESVLADGVRVEDWNAATLAIGDRLAQALDLPQWPLNEQGRMADRIAATVQGWMNESGDLLENPVEIIRALLENERFGAIAPERVDADSFTLARAALAERNFAFARRLGGDETLGDILDEAVREAGLWLSGAAGTMRLLFCDPTPHPARIERELGFAHALEPDRPAAVIAPANYMPPDAVELVGAALSQGRGRPSFQFPPERVAVGAIPKQFRVAWLDLTRPVAPGDIGELFWAHLNEAPFEYAQVYLPGACLLLAGEIVRLTDPPLDLTEAPAWVTTVEMDATGRVALALRGPWAGPYLWKEDLGHYIRRYAFGGQIVIVLDDAPVATLNRAGALRLAGRLRELPALSAGPFDAPVVWSDPWLYFSVGAAGVFQPFLRLDAAGNAELAGSARERSMLAMDPGGQSLGAAPDRFWLSADALHGGLEYRPADRILHLRNILIESVRL